MTNKILEEQKKNKPTINFLIEQLPEGNLKEDISDFLLFLKQHKMIPSWYARNSFNVNFKGKRVCRLRVNYADNPQANFQLHLYNPEISVLEQFLSKQTDEMKQSFIKNYALCNAANCRNHCGSGVHKYIKVDGKLYHLCKNAFLSFFNPSPEEFQFGKELIHLRRAYIIELTDNV